MKKLLLLLVFSLFCSAETCPDAIQKPSIIKIGAKGWTATLLGGLALWGVTDYLEKKKDVTNLVLGVLLGCGSYAYGSSAYNDYQLRHQ